MREPITDKRFLKIEKSHETMLGATRNNKLGVIKRDNQHSKTTNLYLNSKLERQSSLQSNKCYFGFKMLF